ncbi:MAG TPA: hydroxyisourate hydrolase [Euzebyales bacterium]
MSVSTHVLDTSRGVPAEGMPIVLEAATPEGGWQRVGATTTNADGRAPDLVGDDAVDRAGVYRMTFDTGAWFGARGADAFYPLVQVQFEIVDAGEHHHVPLLLSPYGYSTYRGS